MELQFSNPERLNDVIRELTQKGAVVHGSGYGAGVWFVRYDLAGAFTHDQRVETPHGPGVIVGFELFGKGGQSLPPVKSDAGGRVIVALDNPAAWPCATEANPNPYFFRSELTVILGLKQ